MSTDIQSLYDQRSEAVANLKELRNKFQNEEISGADMDQEFQKIDDKIKGLDRSIEIAKQEEEDAKAQAEPQEPTGDNRTSQDIYNQEVFPKLLQNRLDPNSLSGEERKVYNELHSRADLGTGSSGGGNLVPTELQDQIIRAMLFMGGVRDVADVRRTPNGNTERHPFSDSTTESGALIDENPASDAASTNPTYSEKKLEAFTFHSKEIIVSEQLLQDSPFDLIEDFRQIFSQRFFNILNPKFTTGTGSSEPEGIVTGANNAGNTTLTNSASAIAREDFINVYYDVPRAYRNNAAYMISDNVLSEVRKLEVGSSDSRPLYQPSAREGEPDRIEGVPFRINNDLDTIGTASGNILTCGDHSKFRIRDVEGGTMKRLEELHALKNQVGFIMFMRHDSKLLDPNGIRVLQMST